MRRGGGRSQGRRGPKRGRDCLGDTPLAGVLGALIVGSVLSVDPWGFAPFGALRFAVISALAIVALGLAMHHGVHLHRWSVVGWGIFLGWGVVVSIVAIDPTYTWIGTPQRHFGLMSWGLGLAAFMSGQTKPGASGRCAQGGGCRAGGDWRLRVCGTRRGHRCAIAN